MKLFDIFKKKTDKKPETIHTEKLDQIAAYVKAHHSKEMIRITAEKVDHTALTDSKFGGYPYWEKGRACVVSESGQPLTLLAQINFEQARLNHPLLPKTGILQFFILADEQYGLNLDEPTKQDTFRIIYHSDIDDSITLEDVKKAGIPTNTQLNPKEDCFPFFGEYKLSFQSEMESLGYSAEEAYEEALAEALYTLYGEEMKEPAYKYLGSEAYDTLTTKLGVWGHKMLGYPNFTQWDPRNSEENKAYDLLLFQMDSDANEILWGDSGVANFFINHQDLTKKDFSKVLYNWDCY